MSADHPGVGLRLDSDLEASFLKIVDEKHWSHDVAFAEADGVMFLCPKCFEANGGRVGTHQIICWRPRVPGSYSPSPGRWEFEGDSLGNLTLTAGSSSIHLTGNGCQAHFYVRLGKIAY